MTSTITIAAVDSIDPRAETADYVCDGIDDSNELIEAIKSDRSGGTTVVLLDGNFVWDTAHAGTAASFQYIPNISILGQGRNVTTIRSLTRTGLQFTEGCDGWLIHGLTFDGQYTGGDFILPDGAKDFEISNFELRYASSTNSDAILMSGADGGYVHDGLIHDAHWVYYGGLDCGIEAQFSRNITVENVEVYNFEAGISLHRHQPDPPMENLIMRNCYCHDNGSFNFFFGNLEYHSDFETLTQNAKCIDCTTGTLQAGGSPQMKACLRAEYVDGLDIVGLTQLNVGRWKMVIDHCVNVNLYPVETQEITAFYDVDNNIEVEAGVKKEVTS